MNPAFALSQSNTQLHVTAEENSRSLIGPGVVRAVENFPIDYQVIE
jgi:hypothetical protein